MDVEKIIAQCDPLVPLPDLVKALNLFYHQIEAERYDRTHDMIWKQELPAFAGLVETIQSNLATGSVGVLDFGCGTGFACYHVAKILGADKISSIVCVDPSKAMLTKCRQRMDGVFANARYVNDTDSFLASEDWSRHFDIVATNSMLHHVYDWEKLLDRLVEFVKPGGFYLMGHEPSSRFLRNPQCRESFSAFLRERRWGRFLDARNWIRHARLKLGLDPDLRVATADAALKAGLTRKLLPPHVVGELVNFHVPHFVNGVARAEGLDFKQIESRMAGLLKMEAVETYAYMGGFLVNRLPGKWRRTAEKLAKEYPLDGANFSVLWKKVG